MSYEVTLEVSGLHSTSIAGFLIDDIARQVLRVIPIPVAEGGQLTT
jgi:hypothetical protein